MPLTNIPKSGVVVPPANSISSPNGVPTGTQNDLGCRTAPLMETNFRVTGIPCFAKCTLYSVSTLFTTQPTWSGMPAGGISRPVAV